MSDKQVTLTLKTIADISDVTQRAKDIQAALNKIQLPQKLKTSFETTFGNLYKEVEKASAELKNGFKTKGDVTKYERTIESINTLLTKLYGNIQNINVEKLDIKVDSKEFKELQQQVDQLQSSLKNIAVDKLKGLEKFKAPSGAQAWKDFFSALRDETPDIEKAEKALDVLQAQVNKANAAGKQGTGIWPEYNKRLDELKGVLTNVKDSMAETTNKITNLNQQQEQLKLNALKEAEQNANAAKTGITNLTNSVNQYSKETVTAAQNSQRFGAELDQFKSRIAYFFGINNAVRLLQRAFRSAYTTIKDLDKALTETAVVTNYTVQDMWGKIPEYTERANKLGVTILDVAQASTLYYQQGLKINEVNAVTTSTLKMARIAGLDAAEATDRMTNALRGFNMEISETNAENVADVYSKLAAMSASNVDEISTAMTKVASLAHNANMDFETTSAFLAQIIETTRESAETAGTALKTVVARFSEVKSLYTKGELLGTDEEGEAIDVNKVSKALRTAGIDLNEYLTGMKGLDDIFIELASKWDSLDQVQQRYIATMAAGSRQQSRFIAMMQDYRRTQELVTAANNAAGASELQYQKTLDSLESKLNKLKNSWNEFITSIANQKIIKLIVDSLRTLLDTINKLTGNSGIAKLAVAFGSFKIGRSFVANMFKGTKFAEMFSKEGLKAGLGFVNGFENILRRGTKLNLKEALFGAVSQDTRVLDSLTNYEERIYSLIGAERDATSVLYAYNESLRALGLTQSDFTKILNSGLTSQQQNLILSDQELFTRYNNIIALEGEEQVREKLNFQKELDEKLTKKGLVSNIADRATHLLSIVGIKSEEVARKGLTGAISQQIAAHTALNATQVASLLTVGKFIAAAMILITIYKTIKKHSPEGKLNSLKEELEKNTTAANEASEAYTNLNDSLKDLEDRSKTIAGLTKGTTEWKEAVRSVNAQILELIDKYPELNKYIKISSDGLISLDAGYETVLQDYQRKADEANFTVAKNKVAVNNQKNVIARNNAENLLNATDEAGNSLIPQEVAEALLATNKEAINKEDISKALEEYNNKQRRFAGEEYTDTTIPAFYQDLIVNTINRSLGTQRTNDAETKAANVGILSNILSSGNYSAKESDLLKNYINNIDLTKVKDLSDLESKAGQYLNQASLDSRYARLLSGEMSRDDAQWFEENKNTIKDFINSVGGNFSELEQVVDGVRSTFENLDVKLQNIGLDPNDKSGWWQGLGGKTLSNVFEKYEGLSPAQQKNITNSITKITEGLTNTQKEQLVNQLFGSNWENIESLDILKTQFQTLGIQIDNIDLQNLINQIIEFKKATSIKATAENLASNIGTQNDIIENVSSGSELSKEQKEFAIASGATKDQFIMTASGWVYTGDPADLIKNFGKANADMYQNALTTYRNAPTEANRENVDQMAQLMGASGESYMRSGMDAEALDNYTKGAEAMLKLNDAGQKYIDKAKAIEKENKALADSYVRSANSATKMIPKYKELTDAINDNLEGLEKEDKDALSKIAKAAKAAFGQDFTTEQIANAKQEFIDFANGVEGSWDKLSDKLISLNADIFNNLSTNMQNVQVEGKNLSDYLQGLKWDTEGQATLDDAALLSSLANDQVAAQQLEAALKAAGIAMDFEWADEWIEVPAVPPKGKVALSSVGDNGELVTTVRKKIRVPKKVVLTNGLKEQSTINSSGGSGGGGGGSKDKQKYWDNPYDELYNLLEDQNEALRTREKLEREYDRILKRRTSTAQELKQNSLDEIANLQRELDIQRQIQAGRRRMINELSQQTHRDEEGKERTFADWGVTKYGWYDEQNGVMRIDWNAIDQVNDPELGGAIEAYISKLEELSQSFEETQTTIESMEDMIREIKERNMQEYLEFEERVYQAIIDREQKVIDEYSALSDTISESNSNILSSLRESIDLERQIRDNTKTEEDIADKEARLAYLQRDTSGANQTEILKLQQELDDARQSYGDTLVDQAIDQLERENEIAEQQRQEQIEIMQAQLDYAERTGQFWPETYDLIATSFNANGTMNENSALANLLMNSDAFVGMSKFGQMNWIKELVEEWLKAQEGLTNWRNENAQDIYTSAENAMSAYDINSGAQKSIWFDGKNWVDEKGNVYNNVQWDEQGQRYTYGSAQAAPATPAQTEAPVSIPTQTSTQAQQYDTYTVKSGDNLSKIASKYGTTWQKIYDANKDIISNPNLIYPGWVLKIPKYAKGGLVDATGLAWLDGTKTSPEMVLSARDTENFIALRNALSQMLAQGGGKGGDNYFNIEINVDELANDYDVDQLADRIKKQIYDDSSYRNVNAISYLR